MTAIIDIDSHFEPGDDWLDAYPELAKKLPKLNPGLLAVDAIAGDMLRGVPVEQRPPLKELLPPGMLTLFGAVDFGLNSGIVAIAVSFERPMPSACRLRHTR